MPDQQVPHKDTSLLPHGLSPLSAPEPEDEPDDIQGQTIYRGTVLQTPGLPAERMAAFLSPAKGIS